MSQLLTTDPGLRERKRLATSQRIAHEAARLAKQNGLAATTIDDIAAAADIGRATFFRYFDAKEVAVAEGLLLPWLQRVVDGVAAQPAQLAAMDAVRATFKRLDSGPNGGPDSDPDSGPALLEQGRLALSSPALQAWTLHLHVRFEKAIADTVAPRFRQLRSDDPRPRLVGALTMSAVRISLDTWLASAGSKSLSSLLRSALRSVEIE